MNGQITLEGLIKLLRKNFHIILGWMLGSLLLTALFTFWIIKPRYEATSRIVVNQTENRANIITSTDITTNISLMTTYQNIIMEPIILEDVITKNNIKASLEDMQKKISFQNEEESLVFGIVVVDQNPVTAANLANTTAEVFRNKIGQILPVESVTILSEAVPNNKPVSPKVLENLVYGTMLGFFISLLQIFLVNLLDKRVKSNEIISNLGWINLGSVNEMSEKELKETILPTLENQADIHKPTHQEKKRMEEVRYVRQTQEEVKANKS